ncbi:hypothetical protein EV401DRAFT_42905 [Pisolithus croceorrhizus]|nr:hypothetical protein EV401DRAFT_42905 [Pisolithus croceorrhizus]
MQTAACPVRMYIESSVEYIAYPGCSAFRRDRHKQQLVCPVSATHILHSILCSVMLHLVPGMCRALLLMSPQHSAKTSVTYVTIIVEPNTCAELPARWSVLSIRMDTAVFVVSYSDPHSSATQSFGRKLSACGSTSTSSLALCGVQRVDATIAHCEMYELVPAVFFVFSSVTRPDLGRALPTLGRPERVTVYVEASYFE